MNKLIKQSAFAQGVRQEFLKEGFSEADASVLTRTAVLKKLAGEYPSEFKRGFDMESSKSPKFKKKLKLDDWLDMLPWILGVAGVGALLGTRRGRHLTANGIESIFGSQDRLRAMNKTVIHPLSWDTQSNPEGIENGRKDNTTGQ